MDIYITTTGMNLVTTVAGSQNAEPGARAVNVWRAIKDGKPLETQLTNPTAVRDPRGASSTPGTLSPYTRSPTTTR